MQDLNDKVTGNTLTASEWNEVPSEIQNVIESLEITLSDADLNQLGKAIAGYVANGAFYTDSGAANAYVLSPIGSKQSPPAYTEDFTAIFIATNTNTGASTVNVGGLGVKNISDTSAGGEIVAGIRYELHYRTSTGEFEITNFDQIAQIQRTDDGTVSTTTAVMNDDDTIPQITEGAQVLSVSITPQNAASTLRIKAQVPGAANADAVIIAALHKTGVNDALKAVGINPGTDRREILTLNSEIAAGSTAAQTFTVRVGTNTGATLTINGIGGAQKYGGVNNAFIEVEEILP